MPTTWSWFLHWIPACAGMTGESGRDEVGSDVPVHCRGSRCPFIIPGGAQRRPGIHRAVVVTPAVGVYRCGEKGRIATVAYLQQARRYAHYVGMVASLDSRLRGNDEWEGGGRLSIAVIRDALSSSRAPQKVSSSQAKRNVLLVIPGEAQCFTRHPRRSAMFYSSSRAERSEDPGSIERS